MYNTQDHFDSRAFSAETLKLYKFQGPVMGSGWTDEDLAIAFYLGQRHHHKDDLHLLMTLRK